MWFPKSRDVTNPALQQVAGGSTTTAAQQVMADVPKKGMHALKYDPNFTAGKSSRKKNVASNGTWWMKLQGIRRRST